MKFFAGLVVWALPLAALASFVFGGLWYGLLGRQWMDAAGLSKARIQAAGGQTPAVLVMTFLAELVMAWMFSGLLGHLARGGTKASLLNGMISGGFLWLGFVVTVLVVNHRYQMQSWRLTFIDGGHWLGVLLIQGAILGRFALV